MLSQEEIDALLRGAMEPEQEQEQESDLDLDVDSEMPAQRMSLPTLTTTRSILRVLKSFRNPKISPGMAGQNYTGIYRLCRKRDPL